MNRYWKQLTVSSWSITLSRSDKYKLLASSATHFRPNTRASGLNQWMIDFSMGSLIRLNGRAWDTCQTASHWLRVRLVKAGAGMTKPASDPWWFFWRRWARSWETVGGSLAPAAIASWRRIHPAPALPAALLPSRWTLRFDCELPLIQTILPHMRQV